LVITKPIFKIITRPNFKVHIYKYVFTKTVVRVRNREGARIMEILKFYFILKINYIYLQEIWKFLDGKFNYIGLKWGRPFQKDSHCVLRR
jgi:hypothetical protein